MALRGEPGTEMTAAGAQPGAYRPPGWGSEVTLVSLRDTPAGNGRHPAAMTLKLPRAGTCRFTIAPRTGCSGNGSLGPHWEVTSGHSEDVADVAQDKECLHPDGRAHRIKVYAGPLPTAAQISAVRAIPPIPRTGRI